MKLHRYVTYVTLTMVAVIGLAHCTYEEEPEKDMEPVSLILNADDESDVRAVVLAFAETWNRHDMTAMHELVTEDVEWINVAGNYWRGKAVVFKGHDVIHRTVSAKTSMSVENTVIRSIASGVAVAVATMKFGPVITPTGQELREVKTRGSFILVKHEGMWKIAHFQNTSVDPIAEQNDPVTWDSTGFLPGRGNR